MDYPSCLVISDTAFSKTENNGKTLETLLMSYPHNQLEHLYFRNDEEDRSFCGKFLHVSLYDAIDRIVSLKHKDYFLDENSRKSCERKQEIYCSSVKKVYVKLHGYKNGDGVSDKLRKNAMARGSASTFLLYFAWFSKRWIYKRVYEWNQNFKPEIIILQGAGGIYLYQIALQLAKHYNAKLYVLCFDDFSTVIRKNFLNCLTTKIYNNVFQKVISKSSAVITISEKMKNEYSQRFGGHNYFVFSNAVNYFSENIHGTNHNFVYLGSLTLGRMDVLISIGKALDDLSNGRDKKYRLIIYSGTALSDEQRQLVNEIRSIEYMGFIPSDQVFDVISKSSFLIHVESFDREIMKMTRLSFSTKIGEYLSSNRCIIAIGPIENASIEYLADRHLAYTITENDEKSITLGIEHILKNEDLSKVLRENSLKEYECNYTQTAIDSILKRVIEC